MLILLCVVMLVGSYVAGIIPLIVQLSEVRKYFHRGRVHSIIPLFPTLQEKLKKVSIFGAGLLVGTALTVIIPEGIRAIYSSCHEEHPQGHSHSHNVTGSTEESHGGNEETMIGLTLILGFIFMLIIDQLTHALQHSSNTSQTTSGHGSAKFFFLKDVFRSSAS